MANAIPVNSEVEAPVVTPKKAKTVLKESADTQVEAVATPEGELSPVVVDISTLPVELQQVASEALAENPSAVITNLGNAIRVDN